MTTTPSFLKEVNDLRQIAQSNINTAFQESGTRCGFVEGFTADTRAENEGQQPILQNQ